MTIRPIKSGSDYKSALRRVEELWNPVPGSPQDDELQVLVTLIEAYENVHFSIQTPDPLDAIKFRLEQIGKDYRVLTGILGQRTRVYEVMRGDRALSLNMIRRLHTKLRIPADVLIQPVKKRARKSSVSATGTRRRIKKSA